MYISFNSMRSKISTMLIIAWMTLSVVYTIEVGKDCLKLFFVARFTFENSRFFNVFTCSRFCASRAWFLGSSCPASGRNLHLLVLVHSVLQRFFDLVVLMESQYLGQVFPMQLDGTACSQKVVA